MRSGDSLPNPYLLLKICADLKSKVMRRRHLRASVCQSWIPQATLFHSYQLKIHSHGRLNSWIQLLWLKISPVDNQITLLTNKDLAVKPQLHSPWMWNCEQTATEGKRARGNAQAGRSNTTRGGELGEGVCLPPLWPQQRRPTLWIYVGLWEGLLRVESWQDGSNYCCSASI